MQILESREVEVTFRIFGEMRDFQCRRELSRPSVLLGSLFWSEYNDGELRFPLDSRLTGFCVKNLTQEKVVRFEIPYAV